MMEENEVEIDIIESEVDVTSIGQETVSEEEVAVTDNNVAGDEDTVDNL